MCVTDKGFVILKAHTIPDYLSLSLLMGQDVNSQLLPQHHVWLPVVIGLPALMVMNSSSVKS